MLPHDPIFLRSSSSATNCRFKCSVSVWLCVSKRIYVDWIHIWLLCLETTNGDQIHLSLPKHRFAKHVTSVFELCIILKQMLNSSSYFPIREFLNIFFLTNILPPKPPATCFTCCFWLVHIVSAHWAHIANAQCTLERRKNLPKNIQALLKKYECWRAFRLLVLLLWLILTD